MFAIIKSEIIKYLENTSVRGLPKILKSKDIFLKLLWLLFFLASTIVLVYLLCLLFNRYYMWPITTQYGEKRDQFLSFPDITVCNLDFLAEGEPEDLSMRDYAQFLNALKEKTKIESNSNQNWFNNETNLTLKLQFQKSVLEELSSVSGYIINLKKDRPKPDKCLNLIVDCNFFGTDWFRTIDLCSVINFTRRWNANYYTCYTLKTSNLKPTNSKVLRGLSLILNVGPLNYKQLPYKSSLTNSQARGVQVSVHSPGTPPDLKRGFNVAPGTENIVDIVQTEKSRLNFPYNRLGCTSEFMMPNSTTEKYKSDICIEYCQQRIIKGKYKCFSHLLSIPDESFDDGIVCGNFSLVSKSSDESEMLSYFSNAFSNLLNSLLHLAFFVAYEKQCKDQCLLPCSETIYNAYLTSATWPQPSTQLDMFKKYFVDTRCIEDSWIKTRYINYLNAYNKAINSSDIETVDSNLTQIYESFLEIKFVIKQNFPFYQSESSTYTWDVMIGTVGGMLSLWLGITVASGVEIIELFYVLFKHCWQKKTSLPITKENNNTNNNTTNQFDMKESSSRKYLSTKRGNYEINSHNV
ncbi:hypothetical protein HELRODRAFT_172940 [Helobdella robusta]|uniref:Uncharacterized protein n=1 Tax=Helobdella robusta TaxID=6412 RepID=T1F663_HELRO|nr:hypothetical protein HELRODRAFT_172940 [Helobdella robusta]ESO03912.1 hypothetical protein HELRODRAFT_172940 [Helobdella robusta]